jgi:hypothetical protein
MAVREGLAAALTRTLTNQQVTNAAASPCVTEMYNTVAHPPPGQKEILLCENAANLQLVANISSIG